MARITPTLQNVRKGDAVTFYVRGHYCTVAGVVTKVNKKSFKVTQTNDESYHAKPAFGSYKRTRHGGEGYVWVISQDKRGRWTQNCYFTEESLAKGKKEGRFVDDIEKQIEDTTWMLNRRLERLAELGMTREEVVALVDAAFPVEEN